MTIERVNLSMDLDIRFRKKALEKFGFKKGSISKALTEAIESWLDMLESNADNIIKEYLDAQKDG